MNELIIKGIITGFLLSMMIGPVFFVILETSIRRGVRAALAFDMGVLISDLLYIMIAYIFFSEVQDLTSGKNNGVVKVLGGVLLLIYGAISFFKKPAKQKKDESGNNVNNSKDYLFLSLKGFILNMANPMVIFYWFSVMSLGTKYTSDTISESQSVIFFLSVLLITFFSIDILKILGAKQLRPLVTDKVLKSLNQITGIVFVGFGVFLIMQGILGKV